MSSLNSKDWHGLNDHEASDSDNGSDVNVREESRTARIPRAAKRRRVELEQATDTDGDDSDAESGANSESEDENAQDSKEGPEDQDVNDEDEDEDENDGGDDDEADGEAKDKDEDQTDVSGDDNASDTTSPGNKNLHRSTLDIRKRPSDSILITDASQLKPLTKAELAASKKAVKKTGVVYLSRIPPYMQPLKVKHLLSRFGEIGRIFLSPEDPKAHARRVKFGGNKKRNFEEGWVEFLDKKVAKMVAETLNTTIIGGKKNNFYHDDIWNIKYLPRFKWHHLQAQIAYENASRQAKLRAEISQATRENKTFIRNVERAKMVEKMKESRKRKASKLTEESSSGPKVDAVPREEIEIRRQFRQNKAKGQKANREEGVKSSEAVKRVLGKIF